MAAKLITNLKPKEQEFWPVKA